MYRQVESWKKDEDDGWKYNWFTERKMGIFKIMMDKWSEYKF